MSNNNPTISVVMPAYNAERFLKEAIESILAQTFGDFEFIIIDDGSTDSTESIVRSFDDPRIVYEKNDGNKGLSYSFNKGISLARGDYIARMDSDDISTKDRFHKQYSYLKSHPDLDIIGSSIVTINEKGEKTHLHKRPHEHILIKWSSLFSTPMYHPTIMAKASILKEHHYNEALHNSEDYELWSRLLFTTSTQFANIKRPLLLHRVYPASFTQSINLDKRVVSAHNTISNLGHYIELSDREKKILVRLRQEQRLSILELIKVWLIYFRAARSFVKIERLNPEFTLKVFSKLFELKIFLLKHFIKHLS